MPMPSKIPGLSPAGADLGLGNLLADQVAGETDEMRKKRMAKQQNQQQMGAAAYSLLGGLPGAT